MTKMQERMVSTGLWALLLFSMIWVAGKTTEYGALRQQSQTVLGKAKEDAPVIVIDAGHGGADPGKVGINDVLEKDINLQIAKHLQLFLEAADVRVIMTREGDDGLYDAGADNKKVQDMKRRIALIEETNPTLVVSIHQNSYQESSIHGSQVFYYTGSEKSKTLAEKIQHRLIADLDPENHRQVKANDSYYLLKKTAKPIVIVECGFLSNWEEAEKLATSHYQEKVAWSIHLGILQYMNQEENNEA